MNYADLQQLVEDHLGRSDLSSWFQSFVASAETWLNYGSQETPPLRVREMETIATLTPVSGVVTLPSGVEMVMPGDNISFDVELITPIAMEEKLRFAIREGGRTVGAGVVAKITE